MADPTEKIGTEASQKFIDWIKRGGSQIAGQVLNQSGTVQDILRKVMGGNIPSGGIGPRLPSAMPSLPQNPVGAALDAAKQAIGDGAKGLVEKVGAAVTPESTRSAGVYAEGSEVEFEGRKYAEGTVVDTRQFGEQEKGATEASSDTTREAGVYSEGSEVEFEGRKYAEGTLVDTHAIPSSTLSSAPLIVASVSATQEFTAAATGQNVAAAKLSPTPALDAMIAEQESSGANSSKLETLKRAREQVANLGSPAP